MSERRQTVQYFGAHSAFIILLAACFLRLVCPFRVTRLAASASLSIGRSGRGRREGQEPAWEALRAVAIQVYLDLLRGEGRAKEMAAHLRKQRIGF
jgi:hypothetical protein